MCKEPEPGETVVSEQTFGQQPFVGIKCKTYAREDHTHGTPPAPSIPQASNTVIAEQTFGQSPNAGTSTMYSRGDHTHGTPPTPQSQNPATTVVTEQTFGQSPAVGTLLSYAREDHTHGTPPVPSTYTPGPSADLTSARALETTYQNTTGRPILAIITLQFTSEDTFYPFGVYRALCDNSNPPILLVGSVGYPGDQPEEEGL